jgi:hypothetical protein
MQFDFNFERNEVYECGAALLAVMACARTADDEKSSALYQSLCASALWRPHLERPDDWTPITLGHNAYFATARSLIRTSPLLANVGPSAWFRGAWRSPSSNERNLAS